MSGSRITSELWVAAYKKRLELEAIPMFIVHRGDKVSGAIIVRVSDLKGKAKVFVQSYDTEGCGIWLELANDTDFEIDSFIRKQKTMDPDIWVLEIEVLNGRHMLDDTALSR